MPRQYQRRYTIVWYQDFFIDISYLAYPSIAGNLVLLIVLGDIVDMVWSMFLKHQVTDMQKKERIHKMASKVIPVQIVHKDTLGYNGKLKTRTLKMNITYKFTAPFIPTKWACRTQICGGTVQMHAQYHKCHWTARWYSALSLSRGCTSLYQCS
jgi:hypothetical protein